MAALQVTFGFFIVVNYSIVIVIYFPLHILDASTLRRKRPLSQKSTMNRRHGKNVNRNNGKAIPKNKPKTEDGKNRTDESDSQVTTSEY